MVPGYRRVLLKFGGEMFGGGAVGVDPEVVKTVARQIADVVAGGVQMAVVIGGGNRYVGPVDELVKHKECELLEV